MEKVFSLVNGFLGGLGSLFMAFIPVTILWFVLTGGSVFGMDVIANLTALVNALGNGLVKVLKQNKKVRNFIYDCFEKKK